MNEVAKNHDPGFVALQHKDLEGKDSIKADTNPNSKEPVLGARKAYISFENRKLPPNTICPLILPQASMARSSIKKFRREGRGL